MIEKRKNALLRGIQEVQTGAMSLAEFSRLCRQQHEDFSRVMSPTRREQIDLDFLNPVKELSEAASRDPHPVH
jgi:hypothetical protein